MNDIISAPSFERILSLIEEIHYLLQILNKKTFKSLYNGPEKITDKIRDHLNIGLQ